MEEPTKVAEETAEEGAEEVVEVKETEEVVEEPTEELEPKKQTAQERINEITRLRREAEREAAYWRERATTEEPADKKPDNSGRPELENYETTAEYEDALFDWRDNKTAVARQAAEAQKKQKSAIKTFNKNAASLREVHEDFDEVIESPVFTDTMRAVIFSAETGPDIAYYLGTNTTVARDIAALPPELQPYELGKLETQIKLAQKTKTVSNAPSPITTVNSDTGGNTKDPSKMTTAEWMVWNKENEMDKLKKKLGG